MGLTGAPSLRIVAGDQMHSSMLKSISLLGLGTEIIEWVQTDDQGRIIADKIPILDDKTILMLQAGNVNSGAFDPFDSIIPLAKSKGAWVHIDGAFGLWAKACPSLSHLATGIEKADSLSTDGHKTLNTPYDCGIVFCKDYTALTGALQASASYLVEGQNRDGMMYSPDMSRRARIFELWATLKSLGKSGLSEMILRMHELAKLMAQKLSQIDGLRILNDVVFNQILLAGPSDLLTSHLMTKIQEDSVCWVGPSSWNGVKVIRISICSWKTTDADIRLSCESFQRCWNHIKRS